ncbi:hypothetical protein ACIQZO_07705 [Streptomyces sp. NPDC097617]|uniref:hypothetical protein n=1 Tax=Streptomyces sp. NPDC097617 TaxID=3366091 RepID=UPI0037F344C8
MTRRNAELRWRDIISITVGQAIGLIGFAFPLWALAAVTRDLLARRRRPLSPAGD